MASLSCSQALQCSFRVKQPCVAPRPAAALTVPRLPATAAQKHKCICHAAENSKDAAQVVSSVPSSPALSSSSKSSNSKVLQTDGRQLAQLLLRLSELQVRPHQEWLTDALDTLQPQLTELDGDDLSGCLLALGTWHWMPSAAFMQHFHTATQQLLSQQQLSMRHVGGIAWGLAQLQHANTAVMMADLLEGAEQLLAGQQSNRAGMADLIWALAKLQIHPGKVWLASFEAASQRTLSSLTPHELAQVVWAFARLPWQPSEPWRDLFLLAVQDRLKEFDSKSISLTAWAVATLKFTPTSRWLFNFERQAECVLSTLAAAELACTLWALGELKQKHPHELRLGRRVRRQEVFHPFDFQLLINPRLLKVVRNLTLGPQGKAS